MPSAARIVAWNRRGTGYRVRFALVLALLIAAAAIQGVEPDPCDSQLQKSDVNPHGYRLRGDRCEGVYVQQVASTALLLASFTRAFEEYDLGSDQPLQLDWKSPSGADVRLRARGLRRRLYYRMDAIRAPRATPFSWPSAILSALQIPRADLGVVAWTRCQIGSSERDLYLPVQVYQKGRSAVSNQSSGMDRSVGYQIALMPGVEISEIYVSVAAVGRDGRATRFVQDGMPLGYGYYPSDRAIRFSLPAPGPPGIYYLEAAASLKTGGTTTLTLWVYLPG